MKFWSVEREQLLCVTDSLEVTFYHMESLSFDSYVIYPLWFALKPRVVRRVYSWFLWFYFRFCTVSIHWKYRLLYIKSCFYRWVTESPHFTILYLQYFTSHSTQQAFIIHNNNPNHFVNSCLSALSRSQDGSGNGSSSSSPLDQRFLLKWSVPLSFVEVLEFGSSEDMADSNHYLTPHSGEKVVINAKPSMNHSVTL